jgi:hypothetical protein
MLIPLWYLKFESVFIFNFTSGEIAVIKVISSEIFYSGSESLPSKSFRLRIVDQPQFSWEHSLNGTGT